MIYVITYAMMESGKKISCLFHNAFLDRQKCQKEFDQFPLSEQFPRKSIWAINSDGRRSLITEENYV